MRTYRSRWVCGYVGGGAETGQTSSGCSAVQGVNFWRGAERGSYLEFTPCTLRHATPLPSSLAQRCGSILQRARLRFQALCVLMDCSDVVAQVCVDLSAEGGQACV